MRPMRSILEAQLVTNIQSHTFGISLLWKPPSKLVFTRGQQLRSITINTLSGITFTNQTTALVSVFTIFPPSQPTARAPMFARWRTSTSSQRMICFRVVVTWRTPVLGLTTHTLSLDTSSYTRKSNSILFSLYRIQAKILARIERGAFVAKASQAFPKCKKTCNADNCLRGMRAANKLEESIAFCGEFTKTVNVNVTALASTVPYVSSACSGNVISRVSSACACLPTA